MVGPFFRPMINVHGAMAVLAVNVLSLNVLAEGMGCREVMFCRKIHIDWRRNCRKFCKAVNFVCGIVVKLIGGLGLIVVGRLDPGGG